MIFIITFSAGMYDLSNERTVRDTLHGKATRYPDRQWALEDTRSTRPSLNVLNSDAYVKFIPVGGPEMAEQLSRSRLNQVIQCNVFGMVDEKRPRPYIGIQRRMYATSIFSCLNPSGTCA